MKNEEYALYNNCNTYPRPDIGVVVPIRSEIRKIYAIRS